VAQNSAEDYYVCGLHLRSDLPLPGLALAGDDAAAPTIEIRIGEAGSGVAEPRHTGPTYQAAANDYLLEVRDVARYRVRGGAEIIVEPDARSSERDVRLFLLGTVFGVLCHQRGLLPLHASAIEVAGRCIAFAGRSRAGKSTLAAHYGDRGYTVLADDICVLSFPPKGPPLAWPGVPKMKLWLDALRALGRDPGDLETVRDGLQKYHVPLGGRAEDKPVPLMRVYNLHVARLPQREGIERLSGAAAFDDILNHTYRQHLLAPLGRAQAHFQQCAVLLKQVPMFAVGRGWGFERFAAQADALERHFLDGGA